MTEEQIAWAAGLLEGEGCFSIHKRRNRLNTYNCAIHCEMTDKDVIETLHNIFGVGTVCERSDRGQANRKVSWIWSVQKQKDIFDIFIMILPYMHTRRREKIKEIMEHLEVKVVG